MARGHRLALAELISLNRLGTHTQRTPYWRRTIDQSTWRSGDLSGDLQDARIQDLVCDLG